MEFTRLKRSRIAVTGGNGFLGQALVSRLAATGAEVASPRRRDYDLTEVEQVRAFIKDLSPDIVIHAAATVGGIGANAANPGRYFYENLMMGVPLMHECWKAGVKKFVGLGAISAYPKFAPIPFREDDLWNGYPEETNAPFGLAKKMLLVQAQAYRQQYGFNACVLFPVNLYGPHDNFDPESSHVIPAMIRKFLEARDGGESKVTLWGDGTPTREFLYVADAAEAITLAAESYDSSQPINIGSGWEIPISDLATKIAAQVGYPGKIVWDRSRPNGQLRRKVDTSRAEEELGFKARTTLDEGLERTIAWYEKQRSMKPEIA